MKCLSFGVVLVSLVLVSCQAARAQRVPPVVVVPSDELSRDPSLTQSSCVSGFAQSAAAGHPQPRGRSRPPTPACRNHTSRTSDPSSSREDTATRRAMSKECISR